MSRVFFISIKPTVDRSTSPTIDHLYNRVGLNTGNLLFTNAVWSQIAYTQASSGYEFDPNKINKNYDFVVIPAANWLFERFDFTNLANLVEQLDLPVVIIGVGAQANEKDDIPLLPDATLRLMRAISDRSTSIGARGHYSVKVLEHYGIKNVEAIGCPSMYMGHSGDLAIEKKPLNKMLISGTRYYFSGEDEKPKGVLQRELYRFAYRNSIDVNFQSERPEFDFVVGGGASWDEKIEKRAVQYYDCSAIGPLYAFLKKHGYVFTDVDFWIDKMKDYNFYLGTRIHGSIATLLSGRPACLLAHDTRTRELAEFASIPMFTHKEIGPLTNDTVDQIYGDIDFSAFTGAIKSAYGRYMQFLENNNLPHNLTGM